MFPNSHAHRGHPQRDLPPLVKHREEDHSERERREAFARQGNAEFSRKDRRRDQNEELDGEGALMQSGVGEAGNGKPEKTHGPESDDDANPLSSFLPARLRHGLQAQCKRECWESLWKLRGAPPADGPPARLAYP